MTTATFTMDELVTASSISARTIRYYISSGLLAGPVGQGRTASYTKEGHLDVLKAIQNLKAQGKGLEEIRRILEDQRADFHRRLTTPDGTWDQFELADDVTVQLKVGMSPHRRHRVTHALGTFSKAVENVDEEDTKEDRKCR